MRFVPFLLFIFVSASFPAAADNTRQQELRELRDRIKALQEEIEQATESRSEAADALKHSERRISDVNRGLRRLATRQRELSNNLKQLAVDTETTQNEIAEQQRRLAELLRELISRCALITLMYQSTTAAAHSNGEHVEIVKALAARDEALAVRLMDEHLLHVEAGLTFDRQRPTNDLSLALSS